MSVTSTNTSTSLIGNGVLTDFTFTFDIDYADYATSDIVVTVAGVLQTETTHYTVNSTLKKVVFEATAVPTGTVLISRVIPLTQGTTHSGTRVVPATLNNDLDKLILICQQLQAGIVAAGTGTTVDELPTGEADKGIGWDSTGLLLENKDYLEQADLDAVHSSLLSIIATLNVTLHNLFLTKTTAAATYQLKTDSAADKLAHETRLSDLEGEYATALANAASALSSVAALGARMNIAESDIVSLQATIEPMQEDMAQALVTILEALAAVQMALNAANVAKIKAEEAATSADDAAEDLSTALAFIKVNGQIAIPNGANHVDVVLLPAMSSSYYPTVSVVCSDADPKYLIASLDPTTLTANGFTVYFNSTADSDNYSLYYNF